MRFHASKPVCFVGGLFLLISAQACIIGSTTHSLYLDPDGSVSWLAVERDLRSDRADPRDAAAEEAELIQLAFGARQPVAEALSGLGGRNVEVDVVRDRRPFVFVTRARFERLDTLARALLDQLSIPGSARVIATADRRRFELTFDLHAAAAQGSGDRNDALSGEETVMALVEALEDYRLVLTDGVFKEASGFALDQRRTEATIPRLDEAAMAALDVDGDGFVTFFLEWSARNDDRVGALR